VKEHAQGEFDARFDWGPAGLASLAPAAAIVVVDVLSFSTAVDVATARGASVHPSPWRDAEAAALATRLGAKLAVSRKDADAAHPWSLSPGSLASLAPGDRLVLPSPNGSALSVAAAACGARVFAGCLRNAAAVAAALRKAGSSVNVIGAGERWPDDTLRPAFEDLLGAGAILAALAPARPSPEALAAVAAFRDARGDLEARLLACASGLELAARGFADDVRAAAALGASGAVPELRGAAFADARRMR
jgi:2-phosphosulfolactate phosphatase